MANDYREDDGEPHAAIYHLANIIGEYECPSLRDRFAGMALQGLTAALGRASEEAVAALAYRYADAMLKARVQ